MEMNYYGIEVLYMSNDNSDNAGSNPIEYPAEPTDADLDNPAE